MKGHIMNILSRLWYGAVTLIKLKRIESWGVKRYEQLFEEEKKRLRNDVMIPDEELADRALEAAEYLAKKVKREVRFRIYMVVKNLERKFPPNKKEQNPP